MRQQETMNITTKSQHQFNMASQYFVLSLSMISLFCIPVSSWSLSTSFIILIFSFMLLVIRLKEHCKFNQVDAFNVILTCYVLIWSLLLELARCSCNILRHDLVFRIATPGIAVQAVVCSKKTFFLELSFILR